MKVRLKPALRIWRLPNLSLFQFHEGPIKTLVGLRMIFSNLCFNSMKVRLKRTLVMVILLRVLCFNSMKVRLKPLAARYETGLTMFQFHEGPIKT